jgi:hypothetical protein
MEIEDHSSFTRTVALPGRGRIWRERSTPAGDKAVEAAYQAEHGMRVGLEGETLSVEVGNHKLLPDYFEGVVVDCLQGMCRAPASIMSPALWDAMYHVVCIQGHDVTIGPSQTAHVLETRR